MPNPGGTDVGEMTDEGIVCAGFGPDEDVKRQVDSALESIVFVGASVS